MAEGGEIVQQKKKRAPRNWKELCPTKEAAIEFYNQNFPGLYYKQVREKDSGFCNYVYNQGWDIVPKIHPHVKRHERRNWEVLCPTKEDASRYYQEHLQDKSAKQVKETDNAFYKHLIKKDWLDIITTKKATWHDVTPTKDAAQEYYNTHFSGLTVKEVRKLAPGFIPYLHKKHWTGIFNRKGRVWSFIKTREDAVNYYNAHFKGLKKHDIALNHGSFYTLLIRKGLLDILDGDLSDWSFIKTIDDAIEYYNKNFPGLTPKQLKETEEGRRFYYFLHRRKMSKIVKRELIQFAKFLKTEEDVLKFYNEHFAGMTIGNIHESGKLGAKFYSFLSRNKDLKHVIPRLQGKNDIPPEKQLLGKNLRDYSRCAPVDAEIGENLFQKENGNDEQVKEIDFNASLEDALDFISPEESVGEDTQVKKLLRFLTEQNNKSNAYELSYSDRPELMQLYNSGVSCAQTSAALLYKVFDILNGKNISKVLDLGGAHGSASIKAKSEFEKKTNKDLELVIADMDFSNVHVMINETEARGDKNIELRQVTLPYEASKLQDKNYDLINATYFFCELNPQEIKETIQQMPDSRFFFATLPPSNKEKTDILIQSLAEKGYKVRYGLFPLRLKDGEGRTCGYKVIAIGGTKVLEGS